MNASIDSQPCVRDVMNAAPLWCRPHDSLAVVANLMLDRQISWLPVLSEGKRVVGVLTSRDAFIAAATRRRRLDEVAVEGVMHTNVHACQPDDNIENVLIAMETYGVRRMPVVDADGELVGILSLTDLARRAAHHLGPVDAERVLETLAAIGEPRSAAEKV